MIAYINHFSNRAYKKTLIEKLDLLAFCFLQKLRVGLKAGSVNINLELAQKFDIRSICFSELSDISSPDILHHKGLGTSSVTNICPNQSISHRLGGSLAG